MKLNCLVSKVISSDPQMLGARLIPKKTAGFFRTLVRDSIRTREREGIIRPDMIHLLMQVRQDDLREDGSSSNRNPELETTSIQDNTKNTKMSKTWCVSLVGLAIPSSPQAYTVL
jgi:cytochrome P450 family 9